MILQKRKLNLPKLTELRKLLNESLFNPRKDGPLTLIIENHNGDPNYLECRAMEMVSEARLALSNASDSNLIYQEKMQKAVSLLILARWIRMNNENKS